MGKLIKGVNDLATLYPNLAKEWNYKKNNGLKPDEVTAGSGKKVWWLLPYDDSTTGKHFDFEWETQVIKRVSGEGCPYISGQKVWKGFNDLQTLYPTIAKEWHSNKNGDLQPSDVTAHNNRKVWWVLHYEDKDTGKHFEFEWQAMISERVRGRGCPYICGQAVWKGYNDLATTHPNLCKEWNYKRNINITPTEISAGSKQKVWWLLHYCDEKTGKQYDFEWEATIVNRVQGNGCPYLCGKDVWIGFNDLQSQYPEISKQWHPIKNGELRPSDVTVSSNKKVWWLLSYDDVETGKHFDFEWEATVGNRVQGRGCPYLSNWKIMQGYNDLATLNPNLAKEWHPNKNDKLKPTDVSVCNQRKVWWLCQNGHEWRASIAHRNNGRGCPYCSGSKTEKLLYKYLKEKGISFVAEKKFQSDISIKYLPYDIYLYKDSLVIEADGIQHFEKVNFFTDNFPFEKRVSNDNIKNIFCLNQNIPILRIPYTYHPIDDKEKIEKIVDDFIQTKQVPNEILDFYKPYKDSIGSNYYDVATALNKIK